MGYVYVNRRNNILTYGRSTVTLYICITSIMINYLSSEGDKVFQCLLLFAFQLQGVQINRHTINNVHIHNVMLHEHS